MAEVKTPIVTAQVVQSLFDGTASAGAIKYQRPTGGLPVGFHFKCPCGCGVVGGVSFGPDKWTWNGNPSKPSVQPSIILHTRDGPHWHGCLTDGEWRPV
ncbi:DUF6527 family protein [Brucella intermedia]|uniref:DUF6527 family protein n=1 Tax=Brucella intermedia TaxID=94625 RepID=UPI0026B568ED